jgi:hypothetical protein
MKRHAMKRHTAPLALAAAMGHSPGLVIDVDEAAIVAERPASWRPFF